MRTCPATLPKRGRRVATSPAAHDVVRSREVWAPLDRTIGGGDKRVKQRGPFLTELIVHDMEIISSITLHFPDDTRRFNSSNQFTTTLICGRLASGQVLIPLPDHTSRETAPTQGSWRCWG